MFADEVLALALALPTEERAKIVARETIEQPTDLEVEAWQGRFDELPERWRAHLDEEASHLSSP